MFYDWPMMAVLRLFPSLIVLNGGLMLMKTLSHRQSYIANDLQRVQSAAEQIKRPKPHLLFLWFLLFLSVQIQYTMICLLLHT